MKLLPGLGLLITLVLSTSSVASAQSPSRLGAFSGAMRYCNEHFEDNASRFRNARRLVYREIEGMSRPEKREALRAREHSYSRGQFLGKRLDRNECRSLARASEWARYNQD